MLLSSGADEKRSGLVVRCPVCLHPGRGERRCRACGFLLFGDPVLGAATEEDHRSAAAELAAAAHAWDLDAARRALSGPAEQAEIAGLLRPAPSGIPHPSDGPGPVALPAPAAAAEPHALAELLHRLTTGEVPEVLFVEFGTRRAAVVRAYADAAGLPHARPHAETPWTELVPGLAPAEAPRRFQLAGGIGTVEPVDRPDFDRAVRDWLHAVVPSACGGTGTRTTALVLLRGGVGWTLLDRAAAVLHDSCAARTESAPAPAPGPGTVSATTDRVRRLLRGAPLREPHTLLLARAGTGTGDHLPVELAHHVLFEAGLRLAPGETRTASVTVHGGLPVPPPGGGAAPSETLTVVLPLLAGHYRSADHRPPLLGLPRAELPVLGSAHLTFVLHGPGEIEVRTDGGHILAEAPDGPGPDLRAVLARMPRHLRRPRPVELICAVEMSGTDRAEVAERVGFTSDLIRAAERHGGAGGGLRAAVIGYYDHAPRNEHQPDRKVVRAVRPGTPGRALRHLRELTVEVRPRRSLTSSLEDALREAARMTAGQRDGPADQVLLVVGGRPPAPYTQEGLVPGCPRAVDWREQLRTLRHRGVRVGVRAEPFTAPVAPGTPGGDRLCRYLSRAWRDLTGPDRLLLRPGTDSAEQAALALTAERSHDTDGTPLAFTAPPFPPRPSDPPRS
ncbi:hypothetical protein [Streptomyces sp. AC558_RSS880]|uniref:hypothetical protein n=1 Tax=Streptomyces sp. AC558_RSS880 TaxID=2823687 RepID=UPI001C2509B5|nr:hypothetical protein [Streptomyces sp. AC558_RSS880]